MRRATLNHAYRLVWSHIFNAFVPVPEWTAAKGKRSRGGLAAAVLAAGATVSPVAGAATLEWANGGTGNWTTASNWSPAQLPTGGDIAHIFNGGTGAARLP